MRKRRLSNWIVVAVVTVVLLNLPNPASRALKAVVREALAPVQSILTRVGDAAGNQWHSLWDLPTVYRDNRALEEEVRRLRIERQRLQALARENEELRNLLDMQARAGGVLIPCRVIDRTRDGWWRTLTLSKGQRHGLAPDMAVLSEDGLVGKVVEVSRNTATVLLLSDPSCRVSVRFLASGVFGVVRGRGPSWEGSVICRMDYIDKNALVAPGDEVVTSGFGGVFPPDLPIGYVDDVQRDPSGLYLAADLILRADLGNLRYVFVLDDGAASAIGEGES